MPSSSITERYSLPDVFPPSFAGAWGQDRFGVFCVLIYRDTEQKMRWIPPGTFRMGSPEDETERYDDEVLHEVRLTQGFWMADTPCTRELWEAVMNDNPSRFKESSKNPVEQVSWEDCQKFLEKINGEIPGLHLRLPTEAEWEYACRAGSTSRWCFGNDEKKLKEYAWYDENSGGETHPVKQLKPNNRGLFDVHGNVWEWCADWYGYYPEELQIDPSGPGSGDYRVIRGGSWISGARFVRAAYRYWFDPVIGYGDLGFRFARGQE